MIEVKFKDKSKTDM